MASLHLMGQAYSRRPSEIVGVRDEWAAYQFDLVALRIGLEETNNGDTSPTTNRRRRKKDYRSLKHRARKMEVPESGIW